MGGRRIKAPDGAVRPTQDRVREALFSMLGDRVPGCRFLDLFAGSGAVGIEAWSRGAAFVCWIEAHPRVCAVLKKNVSDLCDGRTRVLRCNAEPFLKKWLEEEPFHIIFADPPYQRQPHEGLLAYRSGSRRRRTQERDGGMWEADADDRPGRRGGGSPAGDGVSGGWECRIIRALTGAGIMARDGLLVMELSSRERVVDQAGCEILNDRIYGDSRLRILHRTA